MTNNHYGKPRSPHAIELRGCKDAVKGPAIIGCTARFQGDDCVNINGKYHYVSGAQGRMVRIAVLNNQLKIKAGDPVEFLPYSGPRPPDVVVRDNVIKGSLQTPIQVHARGGDGQMMPAGALRSISILNNRFEDCVWPLIHVTSTSNLKIEGNLFPEFPPGKPDGAAPPQAVLLENCEPAPPER